MSSTPAHLLSRTPSPFATAQAARRRLDGRAGFDELVGDDAHPAAPAAAARSGPDASAKPRAAGSNPRDPSAKSIDSSGVAADTAADAAQPSLPGLASPSPQSSAAPQPSAIDAAAGKDRTVASAAAFDPETLSHPASPLQEAASSGLQGLEAADAPDDEGAGDGTAAPAGGSAQTADGAAAAVPTQAAVPGGSAAQPLLAAVSGTGATLVKAQGGATGFALRAGATALARGKASAATAAPALKTTDTASPPPVQEISNALIPLAAVNDDARDADGDAAADEDEVADSADGASGAIGSPGFIPLASPASSAGFNVLGVATPLSASAADLAAQMAAKVSAGSSRFQLELNPLGLGRVDVSVSIGRDRQLTAALSFADPQTASALSAHSSDLKTALEQAGFNIPAGGFDFTSSTAEAAGANLQGGFNPGSGSGGGFEDGSAGSGGARLAAFGAGEALAVGGLVDSPAWAGGGDSRLDIRI